MKENVTKSKVRLRQYIIIHRITRGWKQVEITNLMTKEDVKLETKHREEQIPRSAENVCAVNHLMQFALTNSTGSSMKC